MEIDLCAIAPADWEVKSIADVCQRVTSGGTPSRREPAYYEGGVWPWVKTQELQDGWIDDTEEHITEEAVAGSSAKVLPVNTVLVAMYGATVGQLGILRRAMTCNQACCALIADAQKTDFRFLYFQLLQIRSELKNLATGAAQQNLSGAVIKSLRLPFPPIEEQRAIAHILGTLDDKIELNRKQNETLEAMAHALFKAWFVNFEPVRAKMEGRWQRGESLPGLPAHLYDILPDRLIESEFGEIPDGWKYAPLRELASTISKGTTPTKDALNNASDTNVTYFLKVRDITEGGEIARNSLELIPISIHENALKRSILRTDDLLFSIAGTIGRVAIVDEDLNNSNCNQAIAFIRLKDKKNFQSLCWFTLRSKRTQDFVESKIVQGVQANASLATIGEIPVLVPNDGVLPAWNEFVRPLMQELKANQSQSRIVTRLRDALLPKLISGDLRVPDAERIVGATV